MGICTMLRLYAVSLLYGNDILAYTIFCYGYFGIGIEHHRRLYRRIGKGISNGINTGLLMRQ